MDPRAGLDAGGSVAERRGGLPEWPRPPNRERRGPTSRGMKRMSSSGLTAQGILPADGCRGALVGRVWRPDVSGPSVVAIRADAAGEARVIDITATFPTVSDLCEA